MADGAQTAHLGPAIGELHEVRATFAAADQMQEAVSRLSTSGFDRADLSVLEPTSGTPEDGARPADTEEDARQARTLHTSTAASIAALAAAGVTVATGGAAAPAVVAAVVAGAAAGGATYALSSAANADEQEDRDVKAALGELVLTVRAPTREKQAEAQVILQGCGARDIRLV